MGSSPYLLVILMLLDASLLVANVGSGHNLDRADSRARPGLLHGLRGAGGGRVAPVRQARIRKTCLRATVKRTSTRALDHCSTGFLLHSIAERGGVVGSGHLLSACWQSSCSRPPGVRIGLVSDKLLMALRRRVRSQLLVSIARGCSPSRWPGAWCNVLIVLYITWGS